MNELVEFQPGVRVGYLSIARMAREPTALLRHAIDVPIPPQLHLWPHSSAAFGDVGMWC